MNAFESWTTVAPEGDIRVVGAPFPPGTEVEVVVSPRRKAPAEFLAAWTVVCAELRGAAGGLSDAELDDEIEAHRRGQ
jgi:hypothetical protein